MKSSFSVTTAGLALLGIAGCARSAAPPAQTAADGSDAQRLVALVDYVGADYERAVHDGAVVSPFEYEEQLRFAADARRMAGELLSAAGKGEPLPARLLELETRVRERAATDAVRRAAAEAREAAVARFGLRTSPLRRPSLDRGAELYRRNCATCHGEHGTAQTERARTLDPPPASFLERERRLQLSPYRVFNALTFGVPGTSMAAFDALALEERWDLAFYVLRLGHEGQPPRPAEPMRLADLAARSDRELLETLRPAGSADVEARLAHLRREAPYAAPALAAGLLDTRERLERAAAAFAAGRSREADRLALDAYLEGFEPLEPSLRARDAARAAAVESAFNELRAAIAAGDAAGVRLRVHSIDVLLVRAGGRPLVPFVAGALIYLREGVEAALLVGALLAAVRKLGRTEAAAFIHAGWIAALPAGLWTYWVFDRLLAFGAERRELLEAIVALLAATVLFSVSFWMISKVESRRWLGYFKERLQASLGRRSCLVLSGLAFLAVYREAAETVLFTQALLLDATGARREVWAGAAAGLLGVAVAGLVLNRTVLRLPLGPFFAVSSTLLCALAISFAGSGMHALVAAGYLDPRPVPFSGIPWMGIHPDLAGLAVQLGIAAPVGAAGLMTLVRAAARGERP